MCYMYTMTHSVFIENLLTCQHLFWDFLACRVKKHASRFVLGGGRAILFAVLCDFLCRFGLAVWYSFCKFFGLRRFVCSVLDLLISKILT